jgi:cell division septation protein DedD
MPTTDSTADTTLNSSQNDDHSQLQSVNRPSEKSSKPLKGLFFGFAATVTIGLALASWYLGVRIVSVEAVTPAGAAAGRSGNAAPVPSKSAMSVSQPAPGAGGASAPPAALYLQVGALGSKQDVSFVKSLEVQGFRVLLQAPRASLVGDAGSRDSNARILIGPFAGHTEMEQAQRRLQSSGVLAVEIAY